MLELAQSHILSLVPYAPAKAIENNLILPRWAKLGSNENCLGPSKDAMLAAKESLKYAHLYPNAHRFEVVHAVCRFYRDYKLKAEQVALGNGTSELIVNLVRGLLSTNESMLTAWPTFIMYRLAAKAHGATEVAVKLNDDMSYDLLGMLREIYKAREFPLKLVFLANPNNPTGSYLNKDALENFVKELPASVILVIDEAYFEYVTKEDFPNGLNIALSRPRTIVLRTFSKAYGLAGLRMGLAIGCEQVIDVLERVRDPFNVNTAAQYAAIAALHDHEHLSASILHNEKMRPILSEGLSSLGFFVFSSVGNFVLAKKPSSMMDMEKLSMLLLQRGVIVRPLPNYDLADYLRISVGTKEEIELLFSELRHILSSYTTHI